jgi:hypothetical protein
MKRLLTGLGALALCVPLLGAGFGTVTVKLPPILVALKPGPGVEAVRDNCQTCHSAAYIYTQPALTQAQWTAEVVKMKGPYGAPIADRDVAAIVGYLVAVNGKP